MYDGSLRYTGGQTFFLALVMLAVAHVPLERHAVSAQTCVQEQSGTVVTCAANDVRIRFADNTRTGFGAPLIECVKGQSFSFIADFHVQTTALSLYDIGLYFAIDGDSNGDGAPSGICSAHIIKDRHLDPASLNAVMLGSAVAANLDGDECRDITSAQGWRTIGGRIVTLRIDNAVCHDTDGDGRMNLPNCISWSREPSRLCNSPQIAAPASSFDCGCNLAFNLPITVIPGTLNVTENDQTISFVEPKKHAVILSETSNPRKFNRQP